MSDYWQRQTNEFQEIRRRVPGTTYRDWQPTKWQALSLLASAVLEHTRSAGWPVQSALELGCGAATLLTQLAGQGVDGDGVDRDGDALALARTAADTMDVPQSVRLVLHRRDFMDPKTVLPGPADLSFSIGVIEHYDQAEQLEVFRRHIELSRRWVMIAIPNTRSPLFSAFLKAAAADGTLYEEHHVDVDVPAAAARLGGRVVRSDGCHLFLSRHRDYRFADDELRGFQRRLHPMLLAHHSRYRRYPEMDMATADIDALANVESAADRADRLRFGFLRWYLVDCGRT